MLIKQDSIGENYRSKRSAMSCSSLDSKHKEKVPESIRFLLNERISTRAHLRETQLITCNIYEKHSCTQSKTVDLLFFLF